jgi:hypothetical protein
MDLNTTLAFPSFLLGMSLLFRNLIVADHLDIS